MEKAKIRAKLRNEINKKRIMNEDINDFTYGRLYQLVSDKSKLFTSYDRKYYIKQWLQKATKEDVKKEAIKILEDYEKWTIKGQKKMEKRENRDKTESNDWCYIFKTSLTSDSFYTGRCLQFLLDTNGHKYKSKTLNNSEVIINLALNTKKKILEYQLQGRTIHISYNICDCETWTIGDKRCECGNRRVYLDDFPNINDIDDIELDLRVLAD